MLIILIVCILFLSNITTMTLADRKNDYSFSNDLNKDQHLNSLISIDEWELFVFGKIKDLVINEEKIDENISFVHYDFYAESVYIKGGTPAHSAGWGVVPPKFINELIVGNNVSIKMIKEEVYNCNEIKGLVTGNFIFLLYYSGYTPMFKYVYLLWIFFGEFLNHFISPFI